MYINRLRLEEIQRKKIKRNNYITVLNKIIKISGWKIEEVK